jgi:hypothetical protein
MYNLTLVPLFALFSLVFAIPKPGPEKIDELERRDGQIFIGQVRAYRHISLPSRLIQFTMLTVGS